MSSLSGLFLVDTTGINGSGTAGNIMKWQDADSATDSIIYDNGTSIGIGTSSPTAFSGTILHIHDTSISRLKLTNDTTGATNTDGFEIYVAGSDAVLLNR